MNKRIDSIPAEALEALAGHDWPGNIRELENFIERAVILTRGGALEVPIAELRAASPAASSPAPGASPVTLADAEREHILRALEETRWVVGGAKGAAARLGMSRTTLLETREEDADRILDTNVKGVLWGLRHEIAAMLAPAGARS